MYPLYTQSEAQQHIRTLQREAEAVHEADCLRSPIRRKARALFWCDVLGLPVPLYDARYANLGQALSYDWLRRRMRSIMLTVALAAFGLGALVGGWLGHQASLLPVILLGCTAALLAALPVMARSWLLLRMRLLHSLLR